LRLALLLVCLCGPSVVADDLLSVPSTLQLELRLLETQGDEAIARAELESVHETLARLGEREVIELRGRIRQLEQRLVNLNARKDLLAGHLKPVNSGTKQFRDLLKVGMWATLTEIRRGSELTGKYRVRLLTTEEKEKAKKEVEAYRERLKAYDEAREELNLKMQHEQDRVRRAELQRNLETLEEKYRKEGSRPSVDLQTGFYELVEVGKDYAGFRRDGGKVVTYHLLTSIRTIDVGVE